MDEAVVSGLVLIEYEAKRRAMPTDDLHTKVAPRRNQCLGLDSLTHELILEQTDL